MDAASELPQDWVGNVRAYVTAWGLPSLVLLGSRAVEFPEKSLLWAAGLSWMGLACLANARRCGRHTHCRFTGPYFIAMAALSLSITDGDRLLGVSAWYWLAGVTGFGTAAIWVLSERRWGKFCR